MNSSKAEIEAKYHKIPMIRFERSESDLLFRPAILDSHGSLFGSCGINFLSDLATLRGGCIFRTPDIGARLHRHSCSGWN